MKKFLKVGEFARICQTTRDTLLHYARKNLLQPRYTAENGYRFYALEQFWEFSLISLLKETGSSLEEIKTCKHDARAGNFMDFIRERILILHEQHKNIHHRIAMLTDLIKTTEEALSARKDAILFEECSARTVQYHPLRENCLESPDRHIEEYSSKLRNDIETGNSVYPPLGLVIAREAAEHGRYEASHLFSKSDADCHKSTREVKAGNYLTLFHCGDTQSHKMAFHRLLKHMKDERLGIDSDIYVYDQMNYLLQMESDRYMAKYMARIEPCSHGKDRP